MTAAILSILAALIPFSIWWYQRRAKLKADPLELHREAYKQAEKPVAAIDTSMSDDMDELERLRDKSSKQ